MGRGINRLTHRQVQAIHESGRHSDGAGLYLVVDQSGAKRWVFMSWRGGRQIEVGLGGLRHVPLALARERAGLCRTAIAEGHDPRHSFQTGQLPTVVTFGEVADELVASLEHGWRNDKHRAQWRLSLEQHAAPLRSKSVDEINSDDILRILKPIWMTKNETATRLRGRIEKVLDAAKAKGLRTGENPAAWRGNLVHLLPRRQKLQRGHHPAMPWSDVPAFVRRLRERASTSARCLEFVILTAARQGEVVRSIRGGVVTGLGWEEIDLVNGVWTVPAYRMKTGRDHRVPLCPRAQAIVREMAGGKRGAFVFPGSKSDAPLSEMALELQLRRMNAKPYTVHGFRSSFRDWVGETTSFPRELAEAALSHTVGDLVERSYRRGDALQRRREMMDAWEDFLNN